MKVAGADWDRDNEAHFAENGRASREQVDDVLLSRYYPSRAGGDRVVGGKARFWFEGETRHGRYLVVIAAQCPGAIWRPITCWTMSGKALIAYQEWRKTVGR